MTDLAIAPGYLGAVTEARFAAVFASTALATALAAAKLIGVDEKTLSAMTDLGVVRSVPRGKLRAYTERDLRAYLIEGPAEPCRSTSQRRVASFSSTSSSRVVAITDLPDRRHDVPRRGTKSGNASRRPTAG
jgi:hypothetical protein